MYDPQLDPDVARTARIAADVEEAAGALLRADRAIEPVVAVDTTGCVEVRLDRRGRVTRVQIADDWQRRVGDDLATTVTDAVREAYAARAQGWTDVVDREAGGERVDPPAPPTMPSVALSNPSGAVADALASHPDVDTARILDGLLSYMEEAESAFDQALAEVDSLATGSTEGQSRGGHVRARVSGGLEVTAIVYDLAWARQAHTFNLSRETVEAIDAAYASAPDPAAGEAGSRLLRLGQDHDELLRYLSLD